MSKSMLNIFERIIIYSFMIELEENKVKQYCVNGHGDLTLFKGNIRMSSWKILQVEARQ